MKYRHKPAVIEAIQWDGNMKTVEPLFIPQSSQRLGDKTLQIITLEGDLTVSVGDYIAKGPDGDFWPIKPDIFEKRYEPIEDIPHALGDTL